MRALLAVVLLGCAATARPIVVEVSAGTEWKVLHETLREPDQGPKGAEWFVHTYAGANGPRDVIFFHGGWGKVAAAASTQAAIDRWKPALLVNLGTAGGFGGRAAVGDVILARRTVIYDIIEAMGDPDEAIAFFATDLDTSLWPAPLAGEVVADLLVSADHDLVVAEIPGLVARFQGRAGDWESGAIAWTARKNGTPVLILRGVSDVVEPTGDVTYGSMENFEKGSRIVMARLLDLFARAVRIW